MAPHLFWNIFLLKINSCVAPHLTFTHYKTLKVSMQSFKSSSVALNHPQKHKPTLWNSETHWNVARRFRKTLKASGHVVRGTKASNGARAFSGVWTKKFFGERCQWRFRCRRCTVEATTKIGEKAREFPLGFPENFRSCEIFNYEKCSKLASYLEILICEFFCSVRLKKKLHLSSSVPFPTEPNR